MSRGWFADIDREQDGDYVWQPCLDTDQGLVHSFEIWFKTKAECDAHIRDVILPAASEVMT